MTNLELDAFEAKVAIAQTKVDDMDNAADDVDEVLVDMVGPLATEVRRLKEVERRHDALYVHFADVHRALAKWDLKSLTAADSVRRLRLIHEEAQELLLDVEKCLRPISMTGKLSQGGEQRGNRLDVEDCHRKIGAFLLGLNRAG